MHDDLNQDPFCTKDRIYFLQYCLWRWLNMKQNNNPSREPSCRSKSCVHAYQDLLCVYSTNMSRAQPPAAMMTEAIITITRLILTLNPSSSSQNIDRCLKIFHSPNYSLHLCLHNVFFCCCECAVWVRVHEARDDRREPDWLFASVELYRSRALPHFTVSL